MKNSIRTIALLSIAGLCSINLAAMELNKPLSLTDSTINAIAESVLNNTKTLADLQSSLPQELYAESKIESNKKRQRTSFFKKCQQ